MSHTLRKRLQWVYSFVHSIGHVHTVHKLLSTKLIPSVIQVISMFHTQSSGYWNGRWNHMLVRSHDQRRQNERFIRFENNSKQRQTTYSTTTKAIRLEDSSWHSNVVEPVENVESCEHQREQLCRNLKNPSISGSVYQYKLSSRSVGWVPFSIFYIILKGFKWCFQVWLSSALKTLPREFYKAHF